MVKHGKATKVREATKATKARLENKPKTPKSNQDSAEFPIQTLPLKWCILTTKKQFHEANMKVCNDNLLAVL